LKHSQRLNAIGKKKENMKILIELEKMVNYYYALAFLEADDERNLYNELLLDALSYLE
jgi:hypothetical protein